MHLARRDVAAIGLAVTGLLCTGAATWLLVAALLPPSGAGMEGRASPAASSVAAGSTEPSRATSGDVLVDVQGAVRRPGIVRLAPGARVADALQAAGGYSRQADLNAAATSLNLAAVLSDGAQVVVPMIGAAGPAPSAGVGGSVGGGLLNLNTATPEELEALPGIGPVTVQKIVAARTEKPFTTLDEMVERDVIDRGQLEDIRDLVTL